MRSSAVRRGVTLGICLLLTLPLAAQAPAKPESAPAGLPEARDVIERHIKAIGGRDALMAHSSRHVKGTMTIPASGMSGSFEIFEARPNKGVMMMNLAGVGEMNEGFNGTIGWSVNPVTGPSLLQGKLLEEKKLDSDFFGDLQPEKRYSSIKTLERVDFEGRPCYKVQLVRKDGGADIQFYDVATGLRAGTVVRRESQLGAMDATLVESDYKPFGKMLVATKTTTTMMGVQQVLTVTDVQFDKVDPSVFEPPAAIKALIK